tara:strand:+ start:19542 stop:19790 length:249 start_codon:yes stop_codon:yes gene_type:complete
MNETKSTYEILNRTDFNEVTILTISEDREYNGKFKEIIWTIVSDADGNDIATSGRNGNHYDLSSPQQPSIVRLIEFISNSDF